MSVRIAIVGTGSVARKSYLPYLSSQADVELVYFNRTQSKAEDCAAQFGGRVVGSTQELLAAQADAILVLTHETQRFDATMPLLEGRPGRLFFEKPLVARNGQANVCEEDFFQALEILQRADEAGAETAMVFNYRFFDQTLRAREIVIERGFGKLTQASFFVNYACWSHCIDLLGLFGGRAVRIAGLGGETEYKQAVDVAASFRLENGAVGTIMGTNATSFDYSLYEMTLVFEGGILKFNDLDGPLEVYANGDRFVETRTLVPVESRWTQYAASFEKSLAAYLESVRTGGPPPVPGIAGLEELQFEAALRRSITEARPVSVQEEFPLEESR